MYVSRRRGLERGASIVAALVFVGILGTIAFTLQSLTPPTPTVSLMVNPQSQVAQTVATTAAVSDQCNPGEVHTIKETTGSAEKPKDKVVKCYIPDPTSTATPKPMKGNLSLTTEERIICTTAGDPNKCVVRYCPLDTMVSTPGTCIVIKCDVGDSVCIKKYLNTAMTLEGGSGNVIPALLSQSQNSSVAISYPNGSSVGITGSSIINDAFSPQGQQSVLSGQLVQTQNQLKSVSQQLSDCASSGGCDAATVQKLQGQQTTLQAQSFQLSQQLVQQTGLSSGSSVLSDQNVCDSHGCYAYPNTDTQRAMLEQHGYVCDVRSMGSGVACFQPGQTTTAPPPGGATMTAGDIVSRDSFCVRSIEPQVDVVRIPAGSTFPSGCYNDRNAPANSPCPNGVCTGGQTFSQQPPSSGYQLLRPAQQSVFYTLGRMIGSLFGGSGNTTQSQQQVACATNYDQYNQQIQQYQNQQQQYNYQMQQYNYQQQQQYYNGSGYSSYGYAATTPPPPPPAQLPQPCYNNANPSQCSQSPQQPSSAQCTSGTWKPTTQAGNGCVSGWQCIPNSSTTSGTGSTSGTGTTGTGNETSAAPQTPTAQLSCQPQIVDIGMKLSISFACQNARASVGQGFDTGGRLASSTEVIVAIPPYNMNVATYGLTCTNFGITSGAQCSVQVGKPAITLVANPSKVQPGERSAIGWVTSSMRSCVASSPQSSDFTAQNANNTDVNGVASTPALTAPMDVSLRCLTLGGATRTATTTVGVL
ncbi:MAG: hypothetical protein UY70_C0032G0005 [Candidatus Kaiserbacteria bacterium GW2011_GWB1_52_6]|uniref:Uncharacterized protein n=2 Tax=Candidatus Kaiseribacteriota TaxID=1752734 RepID=A0A0G1X5H2_9BACT|nr:MAG: hypothetical protein UY67_C0003G0002 [Candidatus Kaiserbacteria bacterium GW2011_GWA2_52_12]KKW26221.1 MAG: hypothetical protein UY70_C0032G0005 [Candidatus Kaiserbacteria bacterium GW2011_GWB1_52_6]